MGNCTEKVSKKIDGEWGYQSCINQNCTRIGADQLDRCQKRNSGISITTGGMTIRAVFVASMMFRPANRILANAKAAKVETAIDKNTDPKVRIMLLANHRKKRPPRRAVVKLPVKNGAGKFDLLSE